MAMREMRRAGISKLARVAEWLIEIRQNSQDWLISLGVVKADDDDFGLDSNGIEAFVPDVAAATMRSTTSARVNTRWRPP